MQHTLIHCLMLALLAVLLLSTRAYARFLPPPVAIRLPAIIAGKSEMFILPPRSTAAAVGSTRVNSPVNTSSPEIQKESTKIVARAAIEGASAVKHIRRAKRELIVDTPYDFHTLHLFCDFDMRGRHRLIWFFPNHCIWVWNNKYVHEGFYRLYKMYQLEAFSFGQYALRLFQLEYDNYMPFFY
ncbi:uncharacterized protein LOC108158303 isoform X4 [Drosophila miranda]|uniref:uncharacterized protein LOC108158303 isoform X4 n=1 Tax=Drosophila miranda TaxID=7229 RepID=UPI00143F59F5|nr:uncharacterized protein LOC108158303 isoform X4 [Drosophila miranda]